MKRSSFCLVFAMFLAAPISSSAFAQAQVQAAKLPPDRLVGTWYGGVASKSGSTKGAVVLVVTKDGKVRLWQNLAGQYRMDNPMTYEGAPGYESLLPPDDSVKFTPAKVTFTVHWQKWDFDWVLAQGKDGVTLSAKGPEGRNVSGIVRQQ